MCRGGHPALCRRLLRGETQPGPRAAQSSHGHDSRSSGGFQSAHTTGTPRGKGHKGGTAGGRPPLPRGMLRLRGAEAGSALSSLLNNRLKKRPLRTISDVRPPPPGKHGGTATLPTAAARKRPAETEGAAHEGRMPHGACSKHHPGMLNDPTTVRLNFQHHAWTGGSTWDGKLRGRKRPPEGMGTLSLDCTGLKCSHWGLKIVSN